VSVSSPMAPWLSIVGIGEDGWDGLNAEAKRLVSSAELLYGGMRHLAHIPAAATDALRVSWPSPMSAAIHEILTEHRGRRRITVLGSGDPMLYGVGVTLTRQLPANEFRVLPQLSAFSLACARLGWPLAETTLVSLVARPVEQLIRYLAPGQRLVLYSEDGTTPAKVAHLLAQLGYGASALHVLERIGGPFEQHRSMLASAWSIERCDNLNLIAVVCVADADTRPLSLSPGLPDDAFETDGQLTKREVRAATLARLSPLPGQILWDVGAGTGTIGIEWMRVHSSCTCIAFESREDRATRIRRNATRLGVPALRVVQGMAPAAFEGLESPHAIFLGGGVAAPGLFEACWARLRPGGRLVANAVTIASEACLASWHKLYGGDLVRIQVAHADRVGGTFVWRQRMPITQWMAIKS
jgi:precorrin-6B C5,15-methyltransferase / cobalt-precorrin-6B C5,C15-methyltransferase